MFDPGWFSVPLAAITSLADSGVKCQFTSVTLSQRSHLVSFGCCVLGHETELWRSILRIENRRRVGKIARFTSGASRSESGTSRGRRTLRHICAELQALRGRTILRCATTLMRVRTPQVLTHEPFPGNREIERHADRYVLGLSGCGRCLRV